MEAMEDPNRDGWFILALKLVGSTPCQAPACCRFLSTTVGLQYCAKTGPELRPCSVTSHKAPPRPCSS
eukprot:273309-Amphidinium_carterae.1